MLSLADVYRSMAGVFGEVGVHSPFPSASETFVAVGHAHRDLERVSVSIVRTIRPMMSDLGTFLNQAIPDIRRVHVARDPRCILRLDAVLSTIRSWEKFQSIHMSSLDNGTCVSLTPVSYWIKEYIPSPF